MAHIEITYRKGYCDFGLDEYCKFCHCDYAKDVGCGLFDDGSREDGFRREDNLRNGEIIKVIPFGDCIHAKFRYGYKGMTVKNYELMEYYDTYNLHMNCMILKTRNGYYECEKVTLDGVCVYGEEVQNA